MNRHFITIFSLLAIAFLSVTVVKFMPDNEAGVSEATTTEEEPSNRDNDVVLFWQHYDKATELRIRGNYSEAREFYGKALDLDSAHQNSLYYMGNMQLADRKFTEAEETWKRLVEIHQRSARGHLQLGNLYSCKTEDNPLFDLTLAKQRFENATRLNAEETGPRLQLAKIHMIHHNYDRAEQMLGNVISSNFRSVEAYYLNGYLKWRSGNSPEAQQQLEKAIAIHSKSSKEAASVGEGETKAGDSPMLANSFRCSLFTEFIQEQLDGMESEISVENVYHNFEEMLSGY